MDVFNYADKLEFGQLHLESDPALQLRAVVAIHDLRRGPAVGGCRFIEYDTTNDALRDVMRLARGMTYKAALANLDHGGGKSVIVRPPNLDDNQRERLFEAFGEFVDELDGKYITCEDSGTTVDDMNVIHRQTDHVLGYGAERGGSGDPSPITAFGVRRGIEACVEFKYGENTDLSDMHVAIQGVGHVGLPLARELADRGAQLTVADVDAEATNKCSKKFDARVVEPESIYDVDCDIFAPCALGGVLNDDTIPRLKCDIVAGSANNQLREDKDANRLQRRNILYAPDYAINAGGLINVAEEYQGYDRDHALEKTSEIYNTIGQILERANQSDESTLTIARRLAEERLKAE